MNDKALQKAYIEVKEPLDGDVSSGGSTKRTLACRFNPKEYTVATSATWTRTPTRGAQQAAKPEFVGTNPRSLQMELFFDDWDSTSGSVAADVETLLTLTNPTQKSLAANKPNPPIVAFHWGSTTFFDAYLKSVSARFTLFRSDGAPLRAVVSVAFEEVPQDAARQNPSSGGTAIQRTRTMVAGDSLQSIAFQEYGDPTVWRALATANRIDDPLRVAVGTSLLVPQPSEALHR